METDLHATRVAMLFTDAVEHVESTQPRETSRDAGARVDLLPIDGGDVQMFGRRPDDLPPFCVAIGDAFVGAASRAR
jgi:putative intracellular protease/amidase